MDRVRAWIGGFGRDSGETNAGSAGGGADERDDGDGSASVVRVEGSTGADGEPVEYVVDLSRSLRRRSEEERQEPDPDGTDS
jgi:hypothetical protein